MTKTLEQPRRGILSPGLLEESAPAVARRLQIGKNEYTAVPERSGRAEKSVKKVPQAFCTPLFSCFLMACRFVLSAESSRLINDVFLLFRNKVGGASGSIRRRQSTERHRKYRAQALEIKATRARLRQERT